MYTPCSHPGTSCMQLFALCPHPDTPSAHPTHPTRRLRTLPHRCRAVRVCTQAHPTEVHVTPPVHTLSALCPHHVHGLITTCPHPVQTQFTPRAHPVHTPFAAALTPCSHPVLFTSHSHPVHNPIPSCTACPHPVLFSRRYLHTLFYFHPVHTPSTPCSRPIIHTQFVRATLTAAVNYILFCACMYTFTPRHPHRYH